MTSTRRTASNRNLPEINVCKKGINCWEGRPGFKGPGRKCIKYHEYDFGKDSDRCCWFANTCFLTDCDKTHPYQQEEFLKKLPVPYLTESYARYLREEKSKIDEIKDSKKIGEDKIVPDTSSANPGIEPSKPKSSTSTVLIKSSEKTTEPNVGDKNKNICSVCCENEVGIIFLSCGHVCSCTVCAPKLKNKCPICRKEGKTQKAYI